MYDELNLRQLANELTCGRRMREKGEELGVDCQKPPSKSDTGVLEAPHTSEPEMSFPVNVILRLPQIASIRQ